MQRTPTVHPLVLLALLVPTGSLVLAAPANANTPAPWVMTGVVRNAAGQPLAGVEVVADNTVSYDMNVVGKTDAQGRYRLELPHEIGTWKPFATISRAWNGQIFRFTVLPNDPSAFQARQGAVRDFVWRVPSHKVNVYYGGSGEVDFDTLEVTFVPQGPLIDGSVGKTFKRRYDGAILDVPVGKYRMSATHAPNGNVEALLVKAEGQDDYAASSIGTFRETMYGVRMELFVRGR